MNCEDIDVVFNDPCIMFFDASCYVHRIHFHGHNARNVVSPLRPLILSCINPHIFKPPPLVGAGGGYMFSGRLSVRASMRPSVIHVVVLCFRDISSIC